MSLRGTSMTCPALCNEPTGERPLLLLLPLLLRTYVSYVPEGPDLETSIFSSFSCINLGLDVVSQLAELTDQLCIGVTAIIHCYLT